jgi:hypothetical protein
LIVAHNKAEQSRAAREREPRERGKQGEANNSKAKHREGDPQRFSSKVYCKKGRSITIENKYAPRMARPHGNGDATASKREK